MRYNPRHTVSSNLTNKYNPQELIFSAKILSARSNLTNKYNPQEPAEASLRLQSCSNLTNKYNPQEPLPGVPEYK